MCPGLLLGDTPHRAHRPPDRDREITRDETIGARSTTEVTTVGSVSVVETGTEQLPSVPPGNKVVSPSRPSPPVIGSGS